MNQSLARSGKATYYKLSGCNMNQSLASTISDNNCNKVYNTMSYCTLLCTGDFYKLSVCNMNQSLASSGKATYYRSISYQLIIVITVMVPSCCVRDWFIVTI